MTRDSVKLPNNISLAETTLRSTEKRINKLSYVYSQKFNEHVQDMVERGVARKMTEEILSHKGPVCFTFLISS